MAVPLIGLTGGMGAGKSTALAALRRLGAEVLSTDEVVHELYGEQAVRDAVLRRWGEEVAPGGTVDRGKVAEIVFADSSERQWLEGMLWPLVGERVAAWAGQVRSVSPPPTAAVLEVPLLFESGLDAACDATISVSASKEAVAKRTSGRGLVSVAERESRQLTQEEKASRATFSIVNDGSVEELERKLSEVLDNLSE